MASIGSVFVELLLNTSRFSRELKGASGSIAIFSRRSKKQLRKVEKDFRKIGRAARDTARGISIASVAIGGGLALIAKKSVGASAEFGAAVSELSAITGATGKDLKFLSNSAREFGASTTLTATQAALAFKLVASAKPDLLENAAALKQVTKETITLAEASGLDLTDAAIAVGSALNQFSAGADQAGRFINVLAAGSKFGASEISDTAVAMQKAGTVAANMGISFEETNAAIQTMAKVSLKAEEAGTGLKTLLIRLATQSRDEFNPEVVGLTKAIKNLAAAHLTTSEKASLFGNRAILAANALIKEADSIDTFTEKLTGTNIAYEQARIRQDNFAGDLKKLNSIYEESKIAIGQSLTPTLRELAGEFINNKDNAIAMTKAIDTVLIGGLEIGAAGVAIFAKSFDGVKIGIAGVRVGIDAMVLTTSEGFDLILSAAQTVNEAFAKLPGDFGGFAATNVALIKIQRIKLQAEIEAIKSVGADSISGLGSSVKDFGKDFDEIDKKLSRFFATLEDGKNSLEAFKAADNKSELASIKKTIKAGIEAEKKSTKTRRTISFIGLQGIIDDEESTYAQRIAALRKFHAAVKDQEVTRLQAFKAGLVEAQIEFENSQELMLKGSKATAFAMRDGFKSGFVDLIKGDIESVPDAFRSMGQAIIDIWVNMIAEMLANWVVSGLLNLPIGIQGIGGSALSGAVSGATGAAVGGAVGSSLFPASVTGAVGAETTVFGGGGISAFLAAHPVGAAVAAIALLSQTNALNEITKGIGNVGNTIGKAVSDIGRSDLNPLNWFASGGVVNQPQVVGVGEAGPEAIVPLSGGRNIPVKITGDTSRAPMQPLQINLVMDGKILARALADMSRDGNLKLDSSVILA